MGCCPCALSARVESRWWVSLCCAHCFFFFFLWTRSMQRNIRLRLVPLPNALDGCTGCTEMHLWRGSTHWHTQKKKKKRPKLHFHNFAPLRLCHFPAFASFLPRCLLTFIHTRASCFILLVSTKHTLAPSTLTLDLLPHYPLPPRIRDVCSGTNATSISPSPSINTLFIGCITSP